MAWSGESKRHSEAAHKAWRTKRRNAKAAEAQRVEARAKARARRNAAKSAQEQLEQATV